MLGLTSSDLGEQHQGTTYTPCNLYQRRLYIFPAKETYFLKLITSRLTELSSSEEIVVQLAIGCESARSLIQPSSEHQGQYHKTLPATASVLQSTNLSALLYNP